MLQSIRILSFVLVGLWMIATCAGAQVCSDPANLTTNCGFDSDNSGWTVLAPSGLAWDPSGNQGPGSALGLGGTGGMEYTFRMYQCIGPVTASTNYGFGAVVQEVVPGTIAGCDVTIEEYSDGTCTTLVAGGAFAAVSSFNGWTDITNTTFTTTATTQSVRLEVHCAAMVDFDVLVDDVYFGTDLLVPVELSSLSVE